MTDLHASNNELVVDAPPKLPQAAEGRGLFISLLLVCLIAMAGWLGFLGWGCGHLLGIW
jgi:hypothetical protein